jgi:hypothetical protein
LVIRGFSSFHATRRILGRRFMRRFGENPHLAPDEGVGDFPQVRMTTVLGSDELMPVREGGCRGS